MSETTIIGKPTTPSVRVSSNDAHRITTPVPRPQRSRPEGSDASAAKRAPVGGQPLKAHTPDVSIGQQPQIDHVTSASSSRTTKITDPNASQRPGRQPQRAGLVGSAAPQVAQIPQDEAQLVNQLLASYHDGLPADAKVARALAARAGERIRRLAGGK